MFRAKKMKKVRVIVLKSQVGDLIKELHEAGLVDIRKAAHEGLEEGRPLASFDEISVELVKLRADLAIMEAAGGKAGRQAKLIDGERALKEARSLSIGQRLGSLSAESAALCEDIKSLE